VIIVQLKIYLIHYIIIVKADHFAVEYVLPLC